MSLKNAILGNTLNIFNVLWLCTSEYKGILRLLIRLQYVFGTYYKLQSNEHYLMPK